MNIYIGNLKDGFNTQEDNIEVDDELLNFICKLNQKVPVDMHKWCGIAPYDDVQIDNSDLKQIIQTCMYILKENLLQGYEDVNEAENTLKSLVKFAQQALDMETGLISIGD